MKSDYLQHTKFQDLTILYVEDDEIIRKNALIYLKKLCKEVWGARDGLEALDLYAYYKPDIIISDIKMPRLDGIEMIQKIRKYDKTTPIILATAFMDTTYLLKAVELQLIKYIVKPVTSVKLLEALNLAHEYIFHDKNSIIHIGENGSYDILNKSLIIDGVVIKLTKNESLLLDILMKNHHRIVTYQEIENYIWLDKEVKIDTLRSLIKFLRKKLPNIKIDNISGSGYRIMI